MKRKQKAEYISPKEANKDRDMLSGQTGRAVKGVFAL